MVGGSKQPFLRLAGSLFADNPCWRHRRMRKGGMQPAKEKNEYSPPVNRKKMWIGKAKKLSSRRGDEEMDSPVSSRADRSATLHTI